MSPKASQKAAAKGKEVKAGKMVIPAAIVLGYVPIITRTYQYDPGFSDNEWFDSTQVVDVFLASKMVAVLIMLSVMICCWFLYNVVEGRKLSFEKRLIPLYIFFCGVLVSGLASPYKKLAWAGSFEMFESVPVVLSYVFFAIYMYRFFHNIEDFRLFWRVAAPGVFIESLICALQRAGLDFLASSFGKHLYLSPIYWSQIDTMSTGMDGAAYGTLYNPDFLPGYFAVIIPLSFAAIFSVKKPADSVAAVLSGTSGSTERVRYIFEKVFYTVIFILAVLAILGSNTATGVFVLLSVVVIFGICCFISKKSHILYLVVTAVISVALIIGLSYTDTPIGSKLKTVFNDSDDYNDVLYIKNFYTLEDEVKIEVMYHDSPLIYHASMEMTDTVSTNPETGEETQIAVPVASLSCDDMEGQSINPGDEAGSTMTAVREDDSQYSVSVTAFNTEASYDEVGNLTEEARQGLSVTVGGHGWTFDRTEEGYKFRNFSGIDIDFPSDIEYMRVFSPSFFNGRGAIWNYTIPKLSRHIVLGSGSNTYVMEYPQNDYLTEWWHSIDVKPHCYYLQQWVENGLVATIALLVFLIWTMLSLLNILITPITDPAWQRWGIWRLLTVASLTGIAAVMVAWIANDSNVCTSPVIWTVFGIALSCIRQGNAAIKSGE